jgi:hypothetical protein
MPLLKISSISPKEKYFRYLPYLYDLFARGRATSKHGGGGRYNEIFRVQGEQIKNFVETEKEEKMRKIKKEQKYESEKKRRKEKNMSMYDIKIK